MSKLNKNQMKIEFVQGKIIEIFKEFILFCDKQKISYGIGGGTLLGAVRHKGFIPWDDDLDVYVSRSDAEKLTRNWNSDRFDLISFQDKKYYKKHTPIKIHDDKFRLIEVGDAECGLPELTNYGIFIDIFIYDEYRDNMFDRLINKYYGKILFAKQLSLNSRNVKNRSRSARFVKFIPEWVINRLTNTLGKMYERRNDGTHIGFGFDTHINNLFIPKNKFLPFVDYEFCGLNVKGPIDCDFYLSQRFGDYMTLPSEKNRIGHIVDIYEKLLIGDENSLILFVNDITKTTSVEV